MTTKQQTAPVCSVHGVHADMTAKAVKDLPTVGTAYELSEFFKILGDPTRIMILSALSRTELCVCDVCEVLGMQQSAVSHQLKLLKMMRLVKHRKEGRMVYYSLADKHVSDIFSCGMEHISEGSE